MTDKVKYLALAFGCGGVSPAEPSGERHGPEGQGGEAGEGGTQYAKTDTAREWTLDADDRNGRILPCT